MVVLLMMMVIVEIITVVCRKVEAGATYSWSVTVETCGGGQTINGGTHLQYLDVQIR